MSQSNSKKSSGQEQQQAVQTFSYTYPHNLKDDSLDLFEILITLWKKKMLIIAITVIAALGSIFYALQLQNIYKAEALLRPPDTMDVLGIHHEIGAEFNLDETATSVEKVFEKFKENLYSRSLHKKFIQEKGLMEILNPNRTAETKDQVIYEAFAKLIILGKSNNGFTTLSIELHDAKIAAQLVNDLIEFVNKETIAMLIENSKNSITNMIQNIEYTIASKRQMAKKRREDQIIRYYEAAQIADSLGIKRRVDATNIIQTTQMNVDIATASTPLYYLGYEALMTEISVLENRKSDDPFISGLRDLQEQHALLNSIKFDPKKIRAVIIDQAAYPPKYGSKPNRRLIVSLATLVGFFLGIFLVLLIGFIQNHKTEHSE